MRLLFCIVILAVGWILGSLYPAPEALLAPIKERIGAIGANEAYESNLPETNDAERPAASSKETRSSGRAGSDTLDQYRAWMEEARRKHPYPESVERMYSVMICESGGQATIVNPAGPYTGLFQYSAQTWNDDWNEYRDEGILDPRAQIFATALAWQRGMQGHWGCYSRSR